MEPLPTLHVRPAGALASSGELAVQSQEHVLSAIQALSGFAAQITSLAPPVIPGVTVSVQALDTPPTTDDLTPRFPAMPDETTLGTVPQLDIGDTPVYDIAPPDLMAIPLPDPFSILVPDQPLLDAMPVTVAQDFVLPPVPTMLSLNLPGAPTITISLFDATAGTAPAMPDVPLIHDEVAYNSTLLAEMNGRLTSLVTTSQSGFDLAVGTRRKSVQFPVRQGKAAGRPAGPLAKRHVQGHRLGATAHSRQRHVQLQNLVR